MDPAILNFALNLVRAMCAAIPYHPYAAAFQLPAAQTGAGDDAMPIVLECAPSFLPQECLEAQFYGKLTLSCHLTLRCCRAMNGQEHVHA